MMDVGHVSMLMLGLWMFMRMRMSFLIITMRMEFVIMAMNVFMDHRHVDVKMGVLFIRQQQRSSYHHDRGDAK